MKAADLDRACVSNTLVIARLAYKHALARFEEEPTDASRLSLSRAEDNLSYLERRAREPDESGDEPL